MWFDLFARKNKRQKAGTAPSPADLKDNLKIYDIFRDYVKHEDELINHRLTWIVYIHGFLYATYGFTLQKKLEIAQDIAQYLSSHPCVSLHQYMRTGPLCGINFEIEVFLLFISVIGLFISYSGLSSIKAANNSIINVEEIFKRRYHQYQEVIEIPYITGGGISENVKYGMFASENIPIIMARGWWLTFAGSILYIIWNLDYVICL